MLRLVIFIFLFFPRFANAAGIAGLQFSDGDMAPALQVMALLTVLSLAPGILIMLSSFTRIVIVLSMLRTALGLQQTPPNSVLISLSLFLTFFSMMPVTTKIYHDAYIPYKEQHLSIEKTLEMAAEPLKVFMLRQTREKDMQLILDLAKAAVPDTTEEIKLIHLIPAFLLSELQTAFQIGFMIFLPFLLVDLIVSGILMTMGMMMLPPMSISLPIKILLFVLIDGWNLVIQSLILSIR